MQRAGDQDEVDARAFRYLADVCGAVAADGTMPIAIPDDPRSIPALVERHRLSTRAIAALADAMRGHDAAVTDRLSAMARTRRLAALRRAERTATISRALSAAGIRHVAIKGPVLAQQIHGDVAARDSKDIDLLVDPAAIAQAASVLDGLGFAEVSGHTQPDEPLAGKHRTFACGDIEVEMHTRLFDIDALMPLSFGRIWPRHDTVMLGGVAVPALSIADTLLYLCAHGAEHVWFRLKWLEDIARIVALARAGTNPSVVADALVAARETGAEAIVTSALHLVEDVFGIAPPGPVSATRTSRALVRLSKEALANPAEAASAPPIGWILRKLPVQWNMARTWRYRSGLVRQLVLAPRGFDAKLPDGLGWLRLPLRPAMLLRDRWITR